MKNELMEAGFERAAENVERLAEVKVRMVKAYEFYRYVTSMKMDEFQAELKKRSWKCAYTNCSKQNPAYCDFCHGSTYDTLKLTPIKEYAHVPPGDVLAKVKEAKERGIFDTFVFGSIEGCGDKFFIAQWGDDVRIEDILADSDG